MLKAFLFGMLGLILVSQLPLVFSASCDNVAPENLETCLGILSSGLNEEEIELLISNLEYDKKYTPDHDFVFGHNTHLDISEPPEDVEKISSTYIKNAWQDLLTTMPSVLYNGSLYVPETTKVFSKYDYEVRLPSNYESSGYPRTSQGDCKRKYYLHSQNDKNKIYVNNDYSGEGELVQVNINQDSELKTKYSINVVVRIRHYEWDHDDEDCDYYRTEYREDSVEIENKLDVKYYESNLFGNLEFIQVYGETTKLRPSFNNSIRITFKDSLFEFKEFMYSINYSKEPYNIYTLVAEDYSEEKTENILKDNNDLLVKDTSECKIKAWDLFNVIEKDCDFNPDNFDLKIKTEHLKYMPDDEIVVEIYPENILVDLNYGTQTKQAQGSTTFIAEDLTNKITATHGYSSDEEIIYIQDRDRFKMMWNLFVFGTLNYLLYCSLIKLKWRFE